MNLRIFQIAENIGLDFNRPERSINWSKRPFLVFLVLIPYALLSFIFFPHNEKFNRDTVIFRFKISFIYHVPKFTFDSNSSSLPLLAGGIRFTSTLPLL